MDVYTPIARVFAMSEDVWRRHANPWSGWTRAGTGIPLLALAIWSRVWLGWGALVVLGLVMLWLWLNPRLFKEPLDFDHWISKGVLGEKVFLENRADIATHHRKAADVLAWASLPGVLVLGWGLWALHLDWVVFGGFMAALPKLWFLDRMVWILEDWQRDGRAVWAGA